MSKDVYSHLSTLHLSLAMWFRIICRQIISVTRLTLATNANLRRADCEPVVSP
ncbi:MAG: hypothetical protein ABSA26_00315 [Thermoguttaceae bacterium]